MLNASKTLTQTPEPPGGNNALTGDEDVYNFIKRERASQKDLNSSQQNLKARSKSNSINLSQDQAKRPTYIETVKQEIQLISKEIRGGPMVQSQQQLAVPMGLSPKNQVANDDQAINPVYYSFGQQKVLTNMPPIAYSGKYVTSKFPGRIE